MKNLLLTAAVKAVAAKDRLAARVDAAYDREQGASLVEQILITVFVAVAVVTIMILLVNALGSQGNNASKCILNPSSTACKRPA